MNIIEAFIAKAGIVESPKKKVNDEITIAIKAMVEKILESGVLTPRIACGGIDRITIDYEMRDDDKELMKKCSYSEFRSGIAEVMPRIPGFHLGPTGIQAFQMSNDKKSEFLEISYGIF